MCNLRYIKTSVATKLFTVIQKFYILLFYGNGIIILVISVKDNKPQVLTYHSRNAVCHDLRVENVPHL